MKKTIISLPTCFVSFTLCCIREYEQQQNFNNSLKLHFSSITDFILIRTSELFCIQYRHKRNHSTRYDAHFYDLVPHRILTVFLIQVTKLPVKNGEYMWSNRPKRTVYKHYPSRHNPLTVNDKQPTKLPKLAYYNNKRH